MSRKPNFDVNVDGRTDVRTDERTNGRTEIWTPISHSAISRCDKNGGRRTTDGRTTEHGYTISSPCEPDGSGELKKYSCFAALP